MISQNLHSHGNKEQEIRVTLGMNYQFHRNYGQKGIIFFTVGEVLQSNTTKKRWGPSEKHGTKHTTHPVADPSKRTSNSSWRDL